MRPHSEVHVLSLTIHVISTDMAVCLADFTVYSKGESEEGKCYEVSYVTGVVLFVITYFHKLIQQPPDDQHRLPMKIYYLN